MLDVNDHYQKYESYPVFLVSVLYMS